jgi:non-canonical (house-cleaning) NTP pyrophosphatase
MLAMIPSRNMGKISGISHVLMDSMLRMSFDIASQDVQVLNNKQPWGFCGTRQAARTRCEALLSKESSNDTMVITQESGLVRWPDRHVRIVNVCVIRYAGEWYEGWAQQIPLTPQLSRLVLKGYELADAFHAVYGDESNRQGEGGVALLTNRKVTRGQLIEQSVRRAIARVPDLTSGLN